jgi:cell division protein YceG involved in septum cleavage
MTKMMVRRVLFFVSFFVLTTALLAAIALWATFEWGRRPLPMVGPSVSVVIPAGSTAQEAAQAWVEGGIRTSP